jgi:CrcB protein
MSAGVWIGLGLLGGVGAVLRHVVDAVITARAGGHLPWGIFAVNLSGAFALGVLAGTGPSADAWHLAGIGLLGAYTTFSTWMLQVDVLRRSGRTRTAVTYVVASVVLGLLAAWAGRGLA